MKNDLTPLIHRFSAIRFIVAVLLAGFCLPYSMDAQDCDLEADFTFTVSGCDAEFTPVYNGPGTVVHEWKFYNGSSPIEPFSSSNISQPIFTFSALPGGGYVAHTVTITLPDGAVITKACAKTVATDCAVTNVCHPAYYYYYQVSGCTVNIMQGFTSLTSTWDFGDMTTPVDAVLPSHTYAASGSHVVSMDYHGKPCSLLIRVACEDEVITDPPVARFRYDLQDALAPMQVTFTVESSYLPTTWDWNFGDGTTSQDNQPIHSYALAGTYDVCLVASNASTNSTFCQEVVIATSGINDPPALPQAQVFPNPFSSDLQVKLPTLAGGEAPHFVLSDLYGRQVTNVSLSDLETVLSLPELPVGVYVWQLFWKGVPTQQGRLVKTK